MRRSPLAHRADELSGSEIGTSGRVRLLELPFLTQIGLRAQPGGAAAEGFAAALGVDLPDRVGRTTGFPETRAVLWLAPDEWLVVAEPDAVGLLDALRGCLPGERGQAVDLSANRTTIELGGSRARDVLEKGVAMDLHPRRFTRDRAIVTSLGPVPVILWRTDDETYRVMPRASFADYTASWLLDAAAEFRQEVSA